MLALSRLTRRAALVTSALALAGTAASAQFKTKGNISVLVIVCNYMDDMAPAFTDVEWARNLTDSVGNYYERATGGRTHVTFKAAGKPCTFPYTFTGLTGRHGPFNFLDAFNDVTVINNEGSDALTMIEKADPSLITDIEHVVVVLNRNKRGRAARPVHFNFGPDRPIPSKDFAIATIFGIDDIAKLTKPTPTETMAATSNFWRGKANLVAHEMGHHFALPDLYRETMTFDFDKDGRPNLNWGPEFAGGWCLMAFQNLQNFCAFSRYTTGWFDEGKVVSIFPPSLSNVVDRFDTLAPPHSATGSEKEMLLISRSPMTTFQPPRDAAASVVPGWWFMVEARPRLGLDADTAPNRNSSPPLVATGGLSRSFTGGVLVMSVQPGFTGIQGVNPVWIRGSSENDRLKDAALTNGEAYVDGGMRIEVTNELPGGRFEVRTRWVLPPVPDVFADGAFLDSPSNGFASATTSLSGATAMPRSDPIFIPVFPEVQWGPPPTVAMREGAADHQLSFRVRNRGSGNARSVKGTLFILDPTIVAGIDLTNIESIRRLPARFTRGLSFGDIPAGGSAIATLTMKPTAAFLSVLVLAPARSSSGGAEVNVVDNVRLDPFVEFFTAPGSPYAPIDMDVPVGNEDFRAHDIRAFAEGLPPRWTMTLGTVANPARTSTQLRIGERSVFHLRVQPPDPASISPEELKETNATRVTLHARMDHGDTWAEVGSVPVDIFLTRRTRVTITGKRDGEKATFSGSLMQREGVVYRPLVNRTVVLTIVGSDGSRRVLQPGARGYMAKTNFRGAYTQSAALAKDVRYVVSVQFATTRDYLGSQERWVEGKPR